MLLVAHKLRSKSSKLGLQGQMQLPHPSKCPHPPIRYTHLEVTRGHYTHLPSPQVLQQVPVGPGDGSAHPHGVLCIDVFLIGLVGVLPKEVIREGDGVAKTLPEE